ncbi:MAG: molybdopterin molybdotransferase MoeA, partial [Betaproteobacteria bacterium]
MLAVEEALARLLAQAQPLGQEDLPTLEAAGRVLAQPVRAAIDVPPMDNSQMDGYALRAADAAAGALPVRLPVSQRIAAGHPGQPLAPQTAARIFTGAPLPPGADAVVMQEAAEAVGDDVLIREAPQPGQWIRRAGIDVQAGARVLAPVTRLGGPQLGLAASVGCAQLTVYRRPLVDVFFTGDELVMTGEPLQQLLIFYSKRFFLI